MPAPAPSPHARLAASFARAFPALADRLDTPLIDPEVERLVEGYVALADRVGRLISATTTRNTQFYAGLVCPEVLRPFPAATIIEVTPGSLAGRTDVPAGAEFDSITVEGTRCHFRAHAPFAVVPYRVSSAKLSPVATGGGVLEIQLQGTRTPWKAEPIFPLRLHLSGERRSALLLLSWIHQHVSGVEVDEAGKTRQLGADAVRLWGYARHEALLPEEPLEHPGFRLMRELMVLWSKFAFFEVRGPADIAPTHGKATLRLRFSEPPPPSISVDADAIRTNCVPVANVFETTADPVEPTLERPEQILRPAGLGPELGEVYMVRSVRARLQSGRSHPVAPAVGFGATTPDVLPGVFYATYASPSRHVVGSDVTIALSTALDAPASPEIHVLSLDLWATQRALPTALGVGAIRVATPTSPPDATFKNIRAVTTYRPAPDGDLLGYHALALASLSLRPLASVGSLQALLAAFDLHGQHDAQAARALGQRIQAIAKVEAKSITERIGGVSLHGCDVGIEIVEGTFDGDGEAFLFGRVLAQLYAYEASLNTFARTTVRLATTGRTFRFPALHGERSFP